MAGQPWLNTVSQHQTLLIFLSSCRVSSSTYHDCKCSLHDAFQRIAQPNTTLLHCIMYLYDPGTLPGSAYQCILGTMYLQSDLLSKIDVHVEPPCIAINIYIYSSMCLGDSIS